MTDHLLEKARTNLQDFKNEYKDLLQRTYVEGQDPRVVMITCSDSRVLPEKMLGLAPGEYFIMRNVANITPPFEVGDPSTSAVLEYAVLTLNIADIVVCGHTDCGGLKAIEMGIKNVPYPSVAAWIRYAEIGMVKPDVGHEDLPWDQKNLGLAEAHVLKQLDNLRTYPYIRKSITAGQLKLHGWVYDIKESNMRYYDEAADKFLDF